MSLRNLNIAPRAFLGFAFIALLVIVLGVFAVNRMSTIRQASIDMETNQLPSVTYLGVVTENVLRLRILSFRILVNRDPAGLQEAQTRIGVLVDKVRSAQASYAALPAESEERALYQTFATTLDNYLQAQNQMMELSRQDKVDEMRTLINTRIKDGTDQMGEQLNKLMAINAAGAKSPPRRPVSTTTAPLPASSLWLCRGACHGPAGLLLTRSIVTPLNRAVQAAQTIAGGNLTQSIEVDGKTKPHNCCKPCRRCRPICAKPSNRSPAPPPIGRRSRRAQRGHRRSLRGLQQQNNEIEQAATAVNEMTAAVEEVARNAVSTSEASNQSTQAAREGRDKWWKPSTRSRP
jgi:methyl-accepting chemotaxis protein